MTIDPTPAERRAALDRLPSVHTRAAALRRRRRATMTAVALTGAFVVAVPAIALGRGSGHSTVSNTPPSSSHPAPYSHAPPGPATTTEAPAILTPPGPGPSTASTSGTPASTSSPLTTTPAPPGRATTTTPTSAGGTPLTSVAWAGVSYPFQCGSTLQGPMGYRLVQVAYPSPEAGLQLAVVMAECATGAGTPSVYLMVFDRASPGEPHLQAMLSAGIWESTGFEAAGAIITMHGYSSSPGVPRCCPDLSKTLSWTWTTGGYKGG